MRIRSIKPEFFDDPKVCAWPPLARVIYVGLWVMADDSGRFPADLELIKGALAKKDKLEDVEKAWNRVNDDGKVSLYTVNSENYGIIRNWWHQKIDKPQPPQRPTPPDEVAQDVVLRALGNPRFRKSDSEKLLRMFADCSPNIRRMIAEHSSASRAGVLGAGSREQGAGSSVAQGGGDPGLEVIQPDEAHRALTDCEELRGLTWHQDLAARRAWPGGDYLGAAPKIVAWAVVTRPNNPGAFLWAQYARFANGTFKGVDGHLTGAADGSTEKPKNAVGDFVPYEDRGDGEAQP